MKATQLKSKKILILGFAREGLSSLKFLRNSLGKEKIGVADGKGLKDFDEVYRKVLVRDKNLELYLGKNYLDCLDKFDVIIKTAGLKLDDKLVRKLSRKGIKITTNLNIFLANIQGKVIGVTGSKGKSTSASLIYQILRQAGKKAVLVGNMGKPFLDYLKDDSSKTIFVAELSSYQLDTLDQSKIEAALITAFFPEHLNYHGSVGKYFQAKMNIVRNLKAGGVVVYCKKYKKIGEFVKRAGINKGIGYSLGSKPSQASGTRSLACPGLLGHHNQENILGCIKMAKLFKVKDATIKKTIKNFKGLPHRLEYAGKYRRIDWFDDAISTTPESTIAGINALKDSGYKLETLIVGGFDRGLNYRKLARKIIKEKIKNVICWPNAGERILKEIKKQRNREIRNSPCRNSPAKAGISQGKEINGINLVKVINMRETVKAAYKYTSHGGAVLLSPAASSYDFYKNFEEKGEEFRKMINTK